MQDLFNGQVTQANIPMAKLKEFSTELRYITGDHPYNGKSWKIVERYGLRFYVQLKSKPDGWDDLDVAIVLLEIEEPVSDDPNFEEKGAMRQLQDHKEQVCELIKKFEEHPEYTVDLDFLYDDEVTFLH